MTFGRAPEWELLPREEIAGSGVFGARLDREQTDIQAALQGAAAQIGEGRQGRILLFSDGNENRGETRARHAAPAQPRRAGVDAAGRLVARPQRDLFERSDFAAPGRQRRGLRDSRRDRKLARSAGAAAFAA